MRTSNRDSRLNKPSVLVLILLLCSLCAATASAQEPPLVYDKENTGASFPKPVFPPNDQLPSTRPLPDPFAFFDGSPRDNSFASWERRRNEIKAAIEKYEIGPKPDKSDLTINAVYTPGSNGGVLVVDVLRNSNLRTLRLTSTINLPSGTPPAAGWPAIIRMALAPGTGANSLGIATIDYVHDDVTQYAAGQQITHAADPYFLMYPEYNAGPCPPAPAPCGTQVGQYSAWAWGVSRLIDGMEIASKQLVNPLPIDLKHLGVNGCSYAGKMALFAGAFDERIAATFAQESGGGGAPAWRVSEGLEPDGTVEKTSNTDGSWFITGMKSDFGHANTFKLPHDHHELLAMVAPRALLVSGNTDFTWLSNRANYVSSRAAQEVYKTFGIGDRFGFYIDGAHGHCAVPGSQQPTIDAFWKKFLLGQNGDWDAHVFPQTEAFLSVDVAPWIPWRAPMLSLPSDLNAEATGPDGAFVNFTGSARDDVDGDVPLTFSPPPGSLFPLGATNVTAAATDADGNSASGAFMVTVRDTTAPAFGSLTASPNVIKPHNHQMVPVTLTANVSDAADPSPATRIVSVTSSEPVSGTGGGDQSPDWEVTGPLTLNLRAESSNLGTGRVYTITVESRDASGNASTRTVMVSVPRK
ncbi:MAG: HYR domain-containing protein [Acidobacteria bacterium]|nr:HYR domain-containing protein [Acidobacteriota bacterium]